ncbi:FkbM family methyltransferase [Actinopolyspora biskrensis]|nr:FkbM family methyltransferase [Actinopolyspora biskrensis]
MSSESALETFTLPDGRELLCTNADDADAVWREILDGTTYSAAAESLEPGETVVDVGAHFGVTSLYFSDQSSEVEVIACEPAPQSFLCLEENFGRHLKSGVCVQTAVGSRSGEAQLTYYPHQTTMATLHVDDEDDKLNLDTILSNIGLEESARVAYWDRSRSGSQHVTVPIRTLSDIFAERGVTRVGLLKVDVERSELDVLLGISESDYRMIRNIVMEVHDVDDNLRRVSDLLRSRGFRLETSQDSVFEGGSVYTVLAKK